MLDLESHLRDHFRHETTGLDPSPTLDDLVHTRRRRRHRHQNLAAASGVLAAALALVLGVASLLATDDDPSRLTTDVGADEADTLYLAPTSLPDGFEKTAVDEGDEDGVLLANDLADPWVNGWERQQRWVQFDEAHEHPVVAIDIVWGPAQEGLSDHVGPYSYDVRVVTLSDSPTSSAERLPGVEAEVRVGLALREGGGLQLDDPPGGFELAGEWPPGVRELTDLRGIRYEAPDGRSVEVWLHDDAELPIAANYGRSSARLVEVRGHPGVLARDPLIAPLRSPDTDPAELYVEWVETSGERVIVAGTGLTADDLLAIADSLDAVDAATWSDLPDDPDVATGGGDDLELPAAGAERIEGTFEGVDRFSISQDECDLRHVSEVTLSVSDDSPWDMRHDQCAQTTDDSWSATGTFTLTAPDGATLTGTSNQRDVPLPSNGDPFDLAITGGTGRFDGATGTCAFDNHISDKEFGSQKMSGTFTCDFTP